jgi:hypothetical protein
MSKTDLTAKIGSLDTNLDMLTDMLKDPVTTVPEIYDQLYYLKTLVNEIKVGITYV